MTPRLSKFYTTLYTALLSVSGGSAIVCLALSLILRELFAMWLVLFAMLTVTFLGILFDCRKNCISAFHRSKLCKGGVCEFSGNGKRKIKAIAWHNVRFVWVLSDRMTSQRWICFSKKRLSTEQSSNPLRCNHKCDFYVLYPYSEKAYKVAMEEVNKHRDVSSCDSE